MIKLNIDCLYLIFNELRLDRKYLYSCLLVNKEWCNIIVPILWKNHSSSASYIYGCNNTILSRLPSSSKQILSDNGVRFPSTILLKPTSFDYVSFCQFPSSYEVYNIIKMMFK